MDPSRVASLSSSTKGRILIRRGHKPALDAWSDGLVFVLLLLWAFSNVCPSPFTDLLYMSSSLVVWAIVCYFINKQETVLRDVISGCDEPGTEAVDSALATETIVDADIPDTMSCQIITRLQIQRL